MSAKTTRCRTSAIPAIDVLEPRSHPSASSWSTTDLTEHLGSSDAAADDQGRIVLATTQWANERHELIVRRFLPSGDVDKSFGDRGVTTPLVISRSGEVAVVVRPDKTIVAAAAGDFSPESKWVFAAYEADGTPDLEFGDGGRSKVAVPEPVGTLADLVALPEGAVMLLTTYASSLNLTRVLIDGTPDPSARPDGMNVIGPNSSGPVGVALAPDGKFLLRTGKVLRRFHGDGRRDATFGTNGVFRARHVIWDMAVGKDGSILLDDGAMALTHVTSDGQADRSFGTRGKVALPEWWAPADIIGSPDGSWLVSAVVRPSESDVRDAKGKSVIGRFGPDGKELGAAVFRGRGAMLLRVDENTATLAGVEYSEADNSQFFHAGTARLSPLNPGRQSWRSAYPDALDVIQVENFNLGGEGVGYHDADAVDTGGGNWRGMLRAGRAAGVDVHLQRVGGRPEYVEDTRPGEWLAYSFNVPFADYFDLSVVAAIPKGGTGGTYHVEIDGKPVTGALIPPRARKNAGWRETYAGRVRLGAGRHVLRLMMDTPGSLGTVGRFDAIRLRQELDPSFGDGGVVPGTSGILYPQPDGTVLVRERNRLTRLGADGSVIASRDLPAGLPNGAKLTPDGGWLYRDWESDALRRLRSDGSPDATFGSNGGLPSDVWGQEFWLLSDGRIQLSDPLERYLPDGTPDPTFRPTGDSAGAVAATLLTDGGLLAYRAQEHGCHTVVDQNETVHRPCHYEVDFYRLGADGSQDMKFGSDGKETIHVGPLEWFGGVVGTPGPDGGAAVAVRISEGIWGNTDMTILLLPPGGNTLEHIELPPTYEVSAMAMREDGLVAATLYSIYNDEGFLHSSTLHELFIAGRRVRRLIPYTEYLNELAFLPDGNLLVGKTHWTETYLAKYRVERSSR